MSDETGLRSAAEGDAPGELDGSAPASIAPDGASPEVAISLDMAKRGLLAAPVLILLAGLIWQLNGAYSAALAVAIVIGNFVWSAALMAIAARISVGALMGAVLFGYLLRLGVLLVAIMLVRDASWISLPAFGLAIIITHLGLLIWEMRYISMTMAFPGLKPTRPPARHTSV